LLKHLASAGAIAPTRRLPPAVDGISSANGYCSIDLRGASARSLTNRSDAMNMSTLKALTWGTVAAAVLSALMLASGELDNERDATASPAMGIALPGDVGEAGGWRNPPAASGRDSSQRLPAGQH
jgi:hypothetical protein